MNNLSTRSRLVSDNKNPIPVVQPPEPPITAQMAINNARMHKPRKAVVVWQDVDGTVWTTWGGATKGEAVDLLETGARHINYE